MKRILFLLLFPVISIIIASAAKPLSVAVYVTGDASDELKEIVYASMANRLNMEKTFIMYERNSNFINAMKKEHDFQTNGDVAENEIRKITSKMGVDYVLIIHLGIISGQTDLNGRLLNLESGMVVSSASVIRDGSSPIAVRNGANNLAYKILNKSSK